MSWKPPSVNDQETERDGAEQRVCPGATGERGRPDHDGDAEERFQQTTPARLVFFEAAEVQMSEHQATCGDGYVEPVGISAPHERSSWGTLNGCSRVPLC